MLRLIFIFLTNFVLNSAKLREIKLLNSLKLLEIPKLYIACLNQCKCGSLRNLQHSNGPMHSIEFELKCQNSQTLKDEISELKRSFFNFRGMFLALLATRKSKINALIDKFLSLALCFKYIFVHPNGYD